MLDFIIRLFVYLGCFVLSMYGLSSVNYEKFIRNGKVKQAQVLYLLVAMGIAKLAAEFLMNIAYKVIP
ncbi:MAG: DUF1146 family protein [Anaerorhabdus sp.]|uniref:DUF1146 domain-containing protein n=1 Tax=bioreactor metagenome TaxID=1076179 RepID=A0A645C5G1_9ZZZZ|nr:DUF1146 family protein [Anaerorhabdus sp.]MEA4874654.1 DUF1146 family protein [Anaerorhabdus sp.]